MLEIIIFTITGIIVIEVSIILFPKFWNFYLNKKD
jgi:hypothetical protein